VSERTQQPSELSDEELAQSGQELPDREVMSTLPAPDGGFVFIEPVDPTTDPPPEETDDGGQVSW
jgi:hypothetical protein